MDCFPPSSEVVRRRSTFSLLSVRCLAAEPTANPAVPNRSVSQHIALLLDVVDHASKPQRRGVGMLEVNNCWIFRMKSLARFSSPSCFNLLREDMDTFSVGLGSGS